MSIQMYQTLVPVNRHLLLEPILEETKEKKSKSSILLPEETKEKIQDKHKCYMVSQVAVDCHLKSAKDKKVLVDNAMVEELKIGDKTYHMVLENYVIGIFFDM
jgi:co-chaperonin GroES (HSP10)